MTLQTWLGFALASALLGLVPGPGVLSIVGYAIGAGRRVALASVAGMMVGNGLAMTLSLFGVGTLLATSALAFAAVKLAGALYLIGLGLITLLRSGRPEGTVAGPVPPVGTRAAFLGNVLVGTFHPKTMVFFVAFVPQFISPGAPYAPQATVLVLTFCGVVGLTDTGYALAAARAARLLSTPRARLWSRRAEGGALVASGLATAAQR
jgi:threonine/homoserine/homoserine lactone efflux protein